MPLETPKITGQEHFRPELHSCDALPVAPPVLEEGEVTVSAGMPEPDGRYIHHWKLRSHPEICWKFLGNSTDIVIS